MTTLWKLNREGDDIVEVTAEIPNYPNLDSEGEKIFDNSHFFMRAAAVAALVKHVEIGQDWRTEDVVRARTKLAEAEKALVDAVLTRKRVRERFGVVA